MSAFNSPGHDLSQLAPTPHWHENDHHGHVVQFYGEDASRFESIGRFIVLQDEERRRIARELHDSLGQYLVGLKLTIDVLTQSPEQPKLWSKATEIVNQCISEVRTLSCLLHPPMIEELGLVSAAQWFVEGLTSRSGIRVTLDSRSDLLGMSAEVELILFRGLQEALTNVLRHSGASAAQVVIRQVADHLVLEVRDNGRGIPAEVRAEFEQSSAGMGVGLTGMRERVHELGGFIRLQEISTGGTSLQINMPLTSDLSETLAL